MTDLPPFDVFLKSLDDDDVSKLQSVLVEYDRSAFVKALKFPWLPNGGPQDEARQCEADELLYGGEAGGGKLADVNELVLTPTGWKRIGDLKVGSKVCAVDGTVTEVIGVFPQGIKANYRVSFHDGTSCLAGLEHNWLGWWTGKPRKVGNQPLFGEVAAAKWTTAEIIEGMAKQALNNREKRFAIPVCQPVVFNLPGCPRKSIDGGYYVKRSIDPYLLGLLIGDGSLSIANSVAITTADDETIEWLTSDYGEDVAIDTKANNKAVNVRFRGETLRWLRHELSSGMLGLAGHKADTKFIPHVYLFGSVDERWALLQGLMDTDGWADIDGDCYYSTVSEKLRDDVAHLARSLGAIVTVTEKSPTYTLHGQKLDGLKAYALRIKVRDSSMLFRLERKLARTGREPQSMAKYVESIEYSHDAESVCIAVRHPSSLYITRDFIVTHNTDLLLGLALTAHRRSLILRRMNKEVEGLVQRMEEILGHRDGFSGQSKIWRLPDHRIIQLGGCQHVDDWRGYQGVPKDLIGFDELANFLEAQYRAIIGWNRTTYTGQRVRVVAASNPPVTPEGQWIVEYWGPWLQKDHPNPALPGELRWFTTVEGKDVEVDGPGPVIIDGKPLTDKRGQPIYPRSRTFIPAELADNPDLEESGYASRLASLPAGMREAMFEGDFGATQKDGAMQVIPAAWVDMAFDRWTDAGGAQPMDVLAVDIAQGGKDKTVLSARHGAWFAPLKVHDGVDTKNGPAVAALIFMQMRDGPEIVLDMGGGYGQSTYDHMSGQDYMPTKFSGADAATTRDRSGVFGFFNMRAQAWWKMRDALDPEYGAFIALPPSPSLKRELCAPTFSIKPGSKILIESKEEVRKRLGHSTDEADAVIMALWGTGKNKTKVRGQKATPMTNKAVTRRR